MNSNNNRQKTISRLNILLNKHPNLDIQSSKLLFLPGEKFLNSLP